MEPLKPEESDCCGSGCMPCVFDVYEAELKKWKRGSNSGFTMGDCSEARHDLLSTLKYFAFKLLKVRKIAVDVNLFKFQPYIENFSHDSPETLGKFSPISIPGLLDYKPSQYFLLRGPSKESFKSLNFALSGNPALFQKHLSEVNETNSSGRNKTLFISRAYTPISVALEEKNCCIDMIIKLYKDGEMSTYLKNLLLGDIVYFRGPFGGFEHDKSAYCSLTMICAGTGIAPMISIIKSIIGNETDETMMLLLFTVRTFENIIFRQEIQDWCRNWNFFAKIYLTNELEWDRVKERLRFNEVVLNQRIDEAVIQAEVLTRTKNQILLCGPSGFCETVQSWIKMGSSSQTVFTF